MMHHSYFHSVAEHGIILWGNFTHSRSVFRLQKRIARIIMGVDTTESCRELFKTLHILPLISQYIFLLILFVVSNNNYQFKINYGLHSINTRHKLSFYKPSLYLSVFQKGHYYMGIKLYNWLSPQIKEFTQNIKQSESWIFPVRVSLSTYIS